MGGPIEERPAHYHEASPITHVVQRDDSRDGHPRLPASLLIYGARDHFAPARDAELLDARLRATGTTSILLIIPWADHAFDSVTRGPSSQLSLYYTERFLAWALLTPDATGAD
jgi:acetyl esterase/lipase